MLLLLLRNTMLALRTIQKIGTFFQGINCVIEFSNGKRINGDLDSQWNYFPRDTLQLCVSMLHRLFPLYRLLIYLCGSNDNLQPINPIGTMKCYLFLFSFGSLHLTIINYHLCFKYYKQPGNWNVLVCLFDCKNKLNKVEDSPCDS